MRLKDTLKGIRPRAKVTEMEVRKISYSSKDCTKGSLFVALKGASKDGHEFAGDAYKRGARAFIAERSLSLPKDAAVIEVSDTRRALSKAAANFYSDPSLEMKVFSVVGTNGKTTTSYILESILKRAGLAPGVIGTINYRYSDKVIPAVNTTPESLDLQRMMREMRDDDVKSAVVEVSSHALHQGRVKGVYFDGGIFTNLTQDHLDYHLNMRNYFLSKRSFFSRVLLDSAKRKDVFAAINVDDKYGKKLFTEFKKDFCLIPFSLKKVKGVYLINKNAGLDGLKLTIMTPAGELEINTRLTGEFNVYNILGAVALSYGAGIALNTIKSGVEDLKNVPGRMQKINTDSGCIFVDYAHTPDALYRVIKSVRGLDVKRVITLFGCGGDRDRTKRAKMGKIANELSDISIVTSDNPRSEEPSEIIEEILKPFDEREKISLSDAKGAARGYLSIIEREKAIKGAVGIMKKGDAVIIAGKGHEDYQIIKGKRFPFDDVKIVEKYLTKKGMKIIR
jgi:UDP-N-acetylmuramoyl-L-alanyl-D-glutamate--2,6-diaminopimelate ligase